MQASLKTVTLAVQPRLLVLPLGALIVKERLKLTDRETVLQIQENPYLQFFLGFPGYSDKKPFHHTSMVHFRKRFDQETLAQINLFGSNFPPLVANESIDSN